MSYVCDIIHGVMVYKKTELFDNDLQELAEIAKVLSHPARLAILRYLVKCKTCISGDISNEIPLSRTTVSQHLQELKRVGLIIGEIDGLKMNYCLCNPCIEKIGNYFQSFFSEINQGSEIKC